MRVQRLVMPVSGAQSWTVVDDDLVPVAPVERFLAHLAAIERSPDTVRAYAYSLALWWEFLELRTPCGMGPRSRTSRSSSVGCAPRRPTPSCWTPRRRDGDAIRRGDHAPGASLPSERELMARYTTTRGTVRRAFSVLVGEGLVAARHGRGVFVRQQPTVHRLGHQRHSAAQRRSGMGPFTAEARRQGQRPEQRLLEVATVPAPPFVSARLNLQLSALALVRRHLLLADDIPMQLADSWFAYDLVKDTPIASPDRIPEGVHAVLEQELGYELDHFIEDLSFRMPTPDEARQLRLSPGVPIVRLLNTLYDANGKPLQVTDFILAGDRHVLQYKVSAR